LASSDVDLELRELAGVRRRAEPVRGGVPWKRGELREGDPLCLRDPAGAPTPFSGTPLGWWDDGSVKWLLVDFTARASPHSSSRYRLTREPTPASAPSPLRCEEQSPNLLRVTTGPLDLVFEGSVIHVTAASGIWQIDALGANLVGDLPGFPPRWSLTATELALQVEHATPQRLVVRLQGDVQRDGGQRLGRIILRVHCVPDADCLRLDHTFVNAADIRSRSLQNAGLLVRGPSSPEAAWGEARYGLDGEPRTETDLSPHRGLRLFQTSAARPQPPGFDQFDPQVLRGVGYQSLGPQGEGMGARLDGWMSWRQGERQLSLAVEDLWQQYPKEIILGETSFIGLVTRDRLEDDELDVDWCGGIRPEDISPTGAPWQCWGEDGVAKTHRVWLAFHGLGEADERVADAEGFLAPLVPVTSPKRCAETGVLGSMAAADPTRFPRTERCLQGLVEWLWRHQTEWSNWYGMLNWGGVQTHYLPVEERWTNLIERYGWMNGETEPQLGVLYQYLRTADPRWLRLGATMVRHLVDVDTVHLGERAGLMRRHFAVHFGQPGDMSHTFLGAPALYYLLTGDERTREVIQSVADTSMRHFNRGYERDSTDAMKNCLWYFEVSGDRRYLEHAEQILEAALGHITEDGGLGIPHDTGFHTNCYLLSALLLYARVFGMQRIREPLQRIMEYEISPRGRGDDSSVSRGLSFEGLAGAYLETGDRRFLWPGLKDLASLSFTRVYQTYTPTVRFPSGVTTLYRPWDGPVRPDSFASIHWLGRLLTMAPHFLHALEEAGMDEEGMPVDGGVSGVAGPFVRRTGPVPADTASLAWDAPSRTSPERVEAPASPARSLFLCLDLKDCLNRAPLALDPFGYDASVRVPQTIEAVERAALGSVVDNLEGLPWGAEAVVGGVPFALVACADRSDPGVVVLEQGGGCRIEVGMAARRLHFFGQVATQGDMTQGSCGARYRVLYSDGAVDEIGLQNLIHYEDWRYLHYAPRAPLAYAWYPKAMSLIPANPEGLAASGQDFLERLVDRDASGHPVTRQDPNSLLPPIHVEQGAHAGTYYYISYRGQRLRHLNQLTVDTEGRDVDAIELIDTGLGHGLALLAVTAEAAEGVPAGRRGALSFCRSASGDHSGETPLALGDWTAPPDPSNESARFSHSAGAVLQTAPGEYRVVLTLSGGPVIVDVRANGKIVVSGLHLLGHWCRDWPDPLQQIGFAVTAPRGEIRLDIDADPGLLYERTLNHYGGNGWVWRPDGRRWERRVPEPWHLVSVEVEEIDVAG